MIPSDLERIADQEQVDIWVVNGNPRLQSRFLNSLMEAGYVVIEEMNGPNEPPYGPIADEVIAKKPDMVVVNYADLEKTLAICQVLRQKLDAGDHDFVIVGLDSTDTVKTQKELRALWGLLILAYNKDDFSERICDYSDANPDEQFANTYMGLTNKVSNLAGDYNMQTIMEAREELEEAFELISDAPQTTTQEQELCQEFIYRINTAYNILFGRDVKKPTPDIPAVNELRTE